MLGHLWIAYVCHSSANMQIEWTQFATRQRLSCNSSVCNSIDRQKLTLFLAATAHVWVSNVSVYVLYIFLFILYVISRNNNVWSRQQLFSVCKAMLPKWFHRCHKSHLTLDRTRCTCRWKCVCVWCEEALSDLWKMRVTYKLHFGASVRECVSVKRSVVCAYHACVYSLQRLIVLWCRLRCFACSCRLNAQEYCYFSIHASGNIKHLGWYSIILCTLRVNNFSNVRYIQLCSDRRSSPFSKTCQANVQECGCVCRFPRRLDATTPSGGDNDSGGELFDTHRRSANVKHTHTLREYKKLPLHYIVLSGFLDSGGGCGCVFVSQRGAATYY